MFLLFKMVMFHCHVSLLEGRAIPKPEKDPTGILGGGGGSQYIYIFIIFGQTIATKPLGTVTCNGGE